MTYHRCPICQDHFAVLVTLEKQHAEELRARFDEAAEDVLWDERHDDGAAFDLPELAVAVDQVQLGVCLVCLERYRRDRGLPVRYVQPHQVQGEDGWHDIWPTANLGTWQGYYADDLRAQLAERLNLVQVA